MSSIAELVERFKRLIAQQAPPRAGQTVVFIYARCSSDAKKGASVESQLEEEWELCQERGWYVADIYVDNDRSASFAAKKEREEYERLVVDLRRKRPGMLVFWEQTRSTRKVRTHLDLVELCQELDIRWCLNGSILDLNNPDDELRAHEGAGRAHHEVRVLSKRITRGHGKAAQRGLPPGGRAPFGYRRVFDERTGKRLGQEIDNETRTAVAADGSTETYTAAGLVAQIITRLAGADSCDGTAKELNARGIPAPQGGRWFPRSVRFIAMNPVYAALRLHRGEVIGAGQWEPIVTTELHQAAVRRLSDPKRKTSRTNKAAYLVSYLGDCGKCGARLSGSNDPAPNGLAMYRNYRCGKRGCVAIARDVLDAYIESVIIERLSDPATLDWLVRPDDTEAQNAAEQAEAARTELAAWKAKAVAGRITPDDYEDISAGIRDRIAELEKRATADYVPMALRGLIGDQAAAAWDALDRPQQREVIRSIMSITLAPAGKGRRPFDPNRVTVSWLLDNRTPTPAPMLSAA